MPEPSAGDESGRRTAHVRSFGQRALRRTARALTSAADATGPAAPGAVPTPEEEVARLHAANERLRTENERLRAHAAVRTSADERRIESLLHMYDALRERYTDLEGDGSSQGVAHLPGRVKVAKVEQAAASRWAFEDLLERLTVDEDFPAAAIAVTHALLATRGRSAARSFAHLLQQQEGWAATGDICLGLVVLGEPMVETAWALFSRVRLPFVLRLAPAEYFRAGFEREPATAQATLEAVQRGDLTVEADAAGWLAIAQYSFAARLEDLSRWALDRATELVDAGKPAQQEVRDEIAWLESWYGRLDAPTPTTPAGEIAVGVLGYQQPDRTASAPAGDEHFEALAVLAQLLRHRELTVTAAPGLEHLAAELTHRIPAEQMLAGTPAKVQLYEVDRDASSYCAVPDGTWLVVTGSLPQAMFDLRTDMPLNPRLRPIFASIHVDRPLLLTEDVLDYLRRYAPIGCRDWRTVALLQAAGVPAFFAGPVTLALDCLASGAGRARSHGEPITEPHTSALAGELRAALDRLGELRRHHGAVKTSDLQTYLAALALGRPVDFHPGNPAEPRLDGLLGLDSEEAQDMRQSLTGKLATVYSAILSGKTEAEVYAGWQEVCAADVDRAETWRHELPPIPPANFDVAEACAEVHRNSVVSERTEAGPSGDEMNVEFSLDGNYRHQLAVVLDSIVEHASRPVRAFVLCRDLGAEDFADFAALFPTVSFVWLPTDHVDYGPIHGMIAHITVATMDRLLLPDLLPDVDKIIHHDLDALCLADLAELYDIDLAGNPIGARTNPHPNFGSGFLSIINYSRHLRESPELASELIRRTHLLHRFDYEVFNAGVLVLDLAQMRADGFSRNFLPFAQRFGLNDQSVLNTYAGARRTAFPSGWNRFPRYEVVEDDPKILHWIGRGKPWRPTYMAAREHWFEAERRLDERKAKLADAKLAD